MCFLMVSHSEHCCGLSGISAGCDMLQARNSASKGLLGLGCQRGHLTFTLSGMWHQTKICCVSHFVCLKTLPSRLSQLINQMETNRCVRNKSFEVGSVLTRWGTCPQACSPNLMREGMYTDTQAVCQQLLMTHRAGRPSAQHSCQHSRPHSSPSVSHYRPSIS